MVKIFIVVPIYNDNKRALDTINKILQITKNFLILVNDGSTDGSGEMLHANFANNTRVTILTHQVNYGKGAAMRTGVEKAWELGAEAVIFIDSDGQHDPRMLPVFEKELRRHLLVFGYREIDNRMPLPRRVFNILVQKTIRILFGMKKRDLFCGYLGMRKSIYKQIRWSSNRYGIETEMGAKVGRRQIPFKEIKIETIYLGKKHGINWKDGLKILFRIPFWYIDKS